VWFKMDQSGEGGLSKSHCPVIHVHVSIIRSSLLQKIHSIFQSKLLTECDLVLPLSISRILSFPEGHQ